MAQLSVGFAMSGSFCTFDRVLEQMKALVQAGMEVTPIQSFNASTLDTRFGKAEDFRRTGTTLGRLANGLSDSPVSLAVKSHLRRSRPVVLAVSTNDALGASMRNIALLKNTKNIYFVPMSQDDAVSKPNSLVADFSRIQDTIAAAMSGMQLQPLFV